MVCASGLSDVITIQSTGTAQITDKMNNTRKRAHGKRTIWRRIKTACAITRLSVLRYTHQAELNNREDQYNREQRPGNRRGTAHPEVAEAALVNMLHPRAGRIERAAAGHHDHL